LPQEYNLQFVVDGYTKEYVTALTAWKEASRADSWQWLGIRLVVLSTIRSKEGESIRDPPGNPTDEKLGQRLRQDLA